MRLNLSILLLLLPASLLFSQADHTYADSLKRALDNATNDTIRMNVYRQLGFYHQDSDADTALVYHREQLKLAEQLKLKLWVADAHQQIAYCCSRRIKLSEAYENYMLALEIANDPSITSASWGFSNFSFSKTPEEARQSIVGMIHFELHSFYNLTRYYKESLNQLFKALEIGESLQNQKILSITNRDIGIYYFNNNEPDSAFTYLMKALEYYKISPYQKNRGLAEEKVGAYYLQRKQYDSAKYYFRHAIDENIRSTTLILLGNAQRELGRLFIETGQLDSALIHTMLGQQVADSLNDLPGRAKGFAQLASIYQLKKEYAIAYEYLLKAKSLDDISSDRYIDNVMQFQNLDFDQKFRLQELEKANQLEKSKSRMILLLMGLAIFLVVALLLYRNNRQQQKANTVLQSALSDLRSAQAQLIQSEKMASLGELTAGIAHEIQNPLNFVNNFSELSNELIDELNDAFSTGDIEEAKTISSDIQKNLEKINHHGKRADAIVKAMLQHSRSSSGQKQPTDINALCDEYLRLAFHGMKAKDNAFEATIETDFDGRIGSINIVPQEIGRVVLNLVNNAFYAVDEKKSKNSSGYAPAVSVSTKKVGNFAEIIVSDNGNGIPEDIKEKIFQPFFTTKPTGLGTGLGLSLSYDIIKAHGGEILLQPHEQNGTVFIIKLPLDTA